MRFKQVRGSPSKSPPSGGVTSHMIRATLARSSVQGKMRKVPRSGTRFMSDSWMRVNPSIEEPSNMISPSRAFPNWLEGTSTFLFAPWMSVNCRRRKRTFSVLQDLRISALVMVVSRSVHVPKQNIEAEEHRVGEAQVQSK